jgi:hypothetical protein
MAKLYDLTLAVRSKNAGVDQVTFDIIFRDRATYDRVVSSGAVTAESVCALFGIARDQMSHFVCFDVANAIKFTLYRPRPNGSPGDWDILGCQQYGPLVEMEVPD